MSDAKGRAGFEPTRSGVYAALLAAPFLLTLWRYHGMAEQFDAIVGGAAGGDLHGLYSYLWQFGSAFVLLLLVPIGLLRWRPRRTLADLGFGWRGSARDAWLLVLAVPLVVAPIAWLGAHVPEIRATYPMLRELHARPDLVLPYEAAYVLLYYVTWEFFFRGYLLFTVETEYGAAAAILVQMIASCLVHIGKPEVEILGSIPVGILFGLIALRTRCIWPTLGLHASLGVLTDLFILWT